MELIDEMINKENIISITGKILNYDKRPDALCNKVYILNSKNGKFVLKIADNLYRQKELQKEIKILNDVKDLINVPEIIYQENHDNYSFFLMKYINGNKPKAFTDELIIKIAKTLRKIHSINQTEDNVNFDHLICLAETNILENRLDINEFIKYKNLGSPIEILNFLKNNKPIAKSTLVHGDFRPKNMLIAEEELYILDWGLSFEGDIYYDFAIIKYYFSDDQFARFMEIYGTNSFDYERLKYNELLSLFLNV